MKEHEELIMIVENATSQLKLLIQKGISSNLAQALILNECYNLISETEKELKKQTK